MRYAYVYVVVVLFDLKANIDGGIYHGARTQMQTCGVRKLSSHDLIKRIEILLK